MTTTFPATDVIDVTQLQQLQLEDPAIRILDVRTGGEFENSHIPGSYNVPLDTLGEHVRDLADVEHPVVLVCQSGGRASQAHEKLTEAGKATLHILEGGMTSWQAAGGDLTVGNTTRWAMDRQVRFVAGTFAIVVLSQASLSQVWNGSQQASALASPTQRCQTPALWQQCWPSSHTTAPTLVTSAAFLKNSRPRKSPNPNSRKI